MKYEGIVDGKQTISLTNADMLVDSIAGDINIKLISFSVVLGSNSIAIVSQNAMASNIYMLK